MSIISKKYFLKQVSRYEFTLIRRKWIFFEQFITKYDIYTDSEYYETIHTIISHVLKEGDSLILEKWNKSYL